MQINSRGVYKKSNRQRAMPQKGPEPNTIPLSQQKEWRQWERAQSPVLTLAFSSRNSGWSGVVWARHCSTSARNRNCAKREKGLNLHNHECQPPQELPSTFRAWSLSSRCASSLPEACAILFPATRFPTIIEAGPTSTNRFHNKLGTVTWLTCM